MCPGSGILLAALRIPERNLSWGETLRIRESGRTPWIFYVRVLGES